MRLPPSLQAVPAAVQGFPDTVRRANTGVRLIVGITLVLISLVAARALYNWLTSGEHEMPPPPVRVTMVVQKSVTAYDKTIGTVMANATVQVTSRVDGQLNSAAFIEGQMVHQGDVLFRLDPKPFQAALAQAAATTARDEASLASARNDARRYSTLAKMGAVAASQRDQYVAQAKALTATVAADKAAADTAALNLEWSVIRSPVDGKTGPILIQPGNLIKANDTNALVTITQIHPVKVSFFLPQSDLPQIQSRMASGALAANIQVHNAAQTRESAKVDFVGNAVSATTGTIELRATFPNTDGRLVPGQVVDVGVALNQYDNVLVVPHEAVNVGPDGRYVYAVVNGNAKLVPVTVLYDDGNTSAVRGALKAGDTVITEGQLRVMPGKPVAIQGKHGGHRGAARQ